jgi:hypothetical protein
MSVCVRLLISVARAFASIVNAYMIAIESLAMLK